MWFYTWTLTNFLDLVRHCNYFLQTEHTGFLVHSMEDWKRSVRRQPEAQTWLQLRRVKMACVGGAGWGINSYQVGKNWGVDYRRKQSNSSVISEDKYDQNLQMGKNSKSGLWSGENGTKGAWTETHEWQDNQIWFLWFCFLGSEDYSKQSNLHSWTHAQYYSKNPQAKFHVYKKFFQRMELLNGQDVPPFL